MKIALNFTLTPEEKINADLFTSFHTTSLKSDVVVTGQRLNNNKVRVIFKKWTNFIEDNYNWDADEYLTLPNPDYNNRFNVLNPISIDSEKVKIYHNHALELEKHEMAHSFYFETNKWEINAKEEIVNF